MGGLYQIRIRTVLAKKARPDGYTQLTIQGDSQLVEPRSGDNSGEYQSMDGDAFSQACRQFADAILAGCEGIAQIQNQFFQMAPGGEVIVGACAIGAAFLGLHPEWRSSRAARISVKESIPQQREIVCWPEGIQLEPDVPFRVITSLNDHYTWPFKQVADWVCVAQRPH